MILMAVGLGLGGLNPADDTLANVDVEGRPSRPAVSWAGANIGQIAGATTVPDAAALARVVASGALALPCFAGQGGPFAGRAGEIRGEVAERDLPALATLYAALMSDLMLTRLGAAAGDLIVEGSLAANPASARSSRRCGPAKQSSPPPTPRARRAARRCSRNGRRAASRPRQ